MELRKVLSDPLAPRRDQAIYGAIIMGKTLLSAFATAAVIATLALASSHSASAAIVTVTYRGTVSFGVDETGVFGAANTILTGTDFTAVYTINDATPGATFSFNPPFSSRAFGAMSAVVTINHHGLVIAGDFSSEASQDRQAGIGIDDVFHSVQSLSGFGVNNEVSSFSPFLTSFDYHAPLFYQVQPGDFSVGFVGNAIDPDTAFANLLSTSVLISSVPELGSWAMMIIGFGGVGLQLRRRRNGIAVPASV
jgi:hypothetical protein